MAQAAIEWTRGRLSEPQRRFLAELPFTRSEDDRLYVHSEASDPPRWRYVHDASGAGRSMQASDAQITFCGHIHRPALYSMSATAKMTSFVPVTGVPVQLLRGRRWLAVLGSVGQPRDGNPAAAFAMFDTDKREITYCRVAYDIAAAAKKIRDNGLPHFLADRLSAGALGDGKALDRARRRHRRLYHRRAGSRRRHGDAVDRDLSRHRRAAADEGAAGLRGRGPRGHRQFRDGADDFAAAVGAACAAMFRHRRFCAAGLCRDGAHPRQDAVQPARRPAAALRRGEGARRQDRRPHSPTCTGKTSFITTSSRAASCSARAARRC